MPSGLVAAAPAPAPAAVAASPAAPAVTPTAAAAAVLAGLGLVDGQLAAVYLLAAEGRDGRLGLLVGAHLHEPEAFGPARVPVHDDLGRLHRAVRLEHLLQVAVGHAVGQVAYVHLSAHQRHSSRERTRRSWL